MTIKTDNKNQKILINEVEASEYLESDNERKEREEMLEDLRKLSKAMNPYYEEQLKDYQAKPRSTYQLTDISISPIKRGEETQKFMAVFNKYIKIPHQKDGDIFDWDYTINAALEYIGETHGIVVPSYLDLNQFLNEAKKNRSLSVNEQDLLNNTEYSILRSSDSDEIIPFSVSWE